MEPARPQHHTYGPNCRLAPVTEPSPQTPLLAGIPPINAQFFYHSLVPIDDPLSTATVTSTADGRPAKGVLRPFSHADNNALEAAWLSLADDDHRNNHDASLNNQPPGPALAAKNTRKLDAIVDHLIRTHKEKHSHDNRAAPLEPPLESLASTDMSVCCQELLIDASNSLREVFCEVSRERQPSLSQKHVVAKVMAVMEEGRPSPAVTTAMPIPASTQLTSSPRTDTFVSPALSTSARGRASSLASNPVASRSASIGSAAKRAAFGTPPQLEKPAVRLRPAPPTVTDGISGKPFLRVGDPDSGTTLEPGPLTEPRPGLPNDNAASEQPLHAAGDMLAPPDGKGVPDFEPHVAEVPVGLSRLHEVSLPVLQMKPIYWSPVNDIAIVSRATWFYRDTMIPVDPSVANQLEAGYRELRAFSQEWQEELRCAVEVGPLGEEKVSFPLWPAFTSPADAKKEAHAASIASDPFCAARCFRGEAAAEGTLEPVGQNESSKGPAQERNYPSHHVLYRNERSAFLLKPSLKPSAYYGRRPLQKIMRGLTVGIPVVRGFDRDSWNELHEKKQGRKTGSQKSVNTEAAEPGKCPGCQTEEDRGQVTDLVLIAHGIGQKFAERVESFHFTHAITAFRRSMNIELRNPAVKSVLREGQNGIMVLPVNWRHHLSFEDGGPMTDADKASSASDNFGLKDIEPNTIPAVRSLISDVMFDIPFYMSHHKPKMISALVTEANRVYRLWCRNNPDFSRNGRVHLIAHSLGSVMFFEFDTTNLFLLGSPAGFFLLLERGSLTPRKGREKPGAEAADTVAKDVVREEGVFGCLAVDNIYNVLAKEDPIAYLLNGTIDPMYAESLRLAHIPSAATSWFSSIRGLIPVGSPPTSELPPALVKPPTYRLPSQLELEVHDFTREEIAERKAFLLNDNGQVDYYLRSGTGPLELQYLNMLSAHTSYWANNDLVRLLCMEIGREPGRANTLPALRAVKLTRRDRAGK
ncbi:DDHD domain-containing protein [Diaporthe amygdali]|uniref:DDHD domain-containing protein n=1 Tax=Phomopsis amygdali TaxID=1214568 RepID=UPI0022FE258A|nr:DDHD domain-containing protein [Diaporthe amygdali]KAJ0125526.1 DDHD domain-containing protein [Diaporthe amygdali]